MELIFRYRPVGFGGDDCLMMTVSAGSTPLLDCEAREQHPDDGGGILVVITPRYPGKTARTRGVIPSGVESLSAALASRDVVDTCTRMIKTWVKSTFGTELDITPVIDNESIEPPNPQPRPRNELAGHVDQTTQRLWHTSQHDRCTIFIAGRIQDDVNALRAAFGLPEFGWNDAIPDEEVGRCSVHPDGCAGQHTHNPPVPFRGEDAQ